MYDHIMFDLDGTVTDSGRAIVASATYALAQFGITDQPLAKLQTFIGPSLFDSFQREYQMNDSDAERAVSRLYEGDGIVRVAHALLQGSDIRTHQFADREAGGVVSCGVDAQAAGQALS